MGVHHRDFPRALEGSEPSISPEEKTHEKWSTEKDMERNCDRRFCLKIDVLLDYALILLYYCFLIADPNSPACTYMGLAILVVFAFLHDVRPCARW